MRAAEKRGRIPAKSLPQAAEADPLRLLAALWSSTLINNECNATCQAGGRDDFSHARSIQPTTHLSLRGPVGPVQHIVNSTGSPHAYQRVELNAAEIYCVK
jgi:hypothetical protein